MNDALLALPSELAAKSISTREVVLPLAKALLAIDILEAANFHILGWEGWVKTADGRVGHGSAGRYASVSLNNVPPNEAANLTRKGISEDAESWTVENEGTTDVLHFCITARLNLPLHPIAYGVG